MFRLRYNLLLKLNSNIIEFYLRTVQNISSYFIELPDVLRKQKECIAFGLEKNIIDTSRFVSPGVIIG